MYHRMVYKQTFYVVLAYLFFQIVESWAIVSIIFEF